MNLSKKAVVWIVMITFLFLSACGVRERLEEEAAQAIAETVIEQATGAEDVNLETGEDGSLSYSVEGVDGETVSVDFNAEADVTAMEGMGYNIPLPEGVMNGVVQRVGTDGEETVVSGQFEVQGITAREFYDSIVPTLIAQGFVYDDPNEQGATQPNPDNPTALLGATFTHPDGTTFSVIWAESVVLLGLSSE